MAGSPRSPRVPGGDAGPGTPPAAHASGNVRHDVGGQALHLLGVVEQRVQQDQVGAGVGDLAQPPTQASGGPKTATGVRSGSPKNAYSWCRAAPTRSRARRRRRPPRCRRAWRSGSPSARRRLRSASRSTRPGRRTASWSATRRRRSRHRAATARRSAAGWLPPNQTRRVRLLERLGLHGRPVELPEATVEGHLGLGPQRLHQLQTLGEPGHQAARDRRRRPRTSGPARRCRRRPRADPGSAGPAC